MRVVFILTLTLAAGCGFTPAKPNLEEAVDKGYGQCFAQAKYPCLCVVNRAADDYLPDGYISYRQRVGGKWLSCLTPSP